MPQVSETSLRLDPVKNVAIRVNDDPRRVDSVDLFWRQLP